MKKSESSSEGEDRISKLPDEVLESILSRLEGGTEEVTRTSILSRRWRYLWRTCSLPSIDIDCTRASQEEFKRKEFKEFVDWVLLNKPLNLDSFRLGCGNYYDMSTINQWIDAAVTRKVKQLDLMFCPLLSEEIELPQCLLTCVSLESLRLFLHAADLHLPKFTGFLPSLRALELNQVHFLNDDNYKMLNYLVESCPSLEDLSLIDCDAVYFVISSQNLKNLRIYAVDNTFYSLEICCPKLEFFMLTGDGYFEHFLFKSLYSLKKTVIHPGYNLELSLDFFAGISHVEYLSVNIRSFKELFDLEVDDPVISLPNLKTLEITMDVINKCGALIPFLKCLPHLESLHLIFREVVEGNGYGKLDDDAEMMRVLTCHLKKVEFLGFDEGPKQYEEEESKLDIPRALLEHGNLLEEMVFIWSDEAKFNHRSMEFANCHKASSTVKLTHVFDPTRVLEK